jgi:hypothetical protein
MMNFSNAIYCIFMLDAVIFEQRENLKISCSAPEKAFAGGRVSLGKSGKGGKEGIARWPWVGRPEQEFNFGICSQAKAGQTRQDPDHPGSW